MKIYVPEDPDLDVASLFKPDSVSLVTVLHVPDVRKQVTNYTDFIQEVSGSPLVPEYLFTHVKGAPKENSVLDTTIPLAGEILERVKHIDPHHWEARDFPHVAVAKGNGFQVVKIPVSSEYEIRVCGIFEFPPLEHGIWVKSGIGRDFIENEAQAKEYLAYQVIGSMLDVINDAWQ